MTVIHVPDIDGPTVQLCWKPQPLLEGMARCDRRTGHGGRHSWETGAGEIKTGGVPASEFSLDFVQGMADRMGMSFIKYGAVAAAYPERVNAIASLKLRLDKYALTRNTEYLIDAANFAMIEFMHPRLAGAFFEPTDAAGSPGRVSAGGNVSQTANTVEDENRRLGGSARTTAGGFYAREGD